MNFILDEHSEKTSLNRIRNREHAKATRLRKKILIEGLKEALIDLQREVFFILLIPFSLLYMYMKKTHGQTVFLCSLRF